jgi:hypothetical protein
VPQENAQKVSKRSRRIRGKDLSVFGEHGKLGLFAVHKIVSEQGITIKCIILGVPGGRGGEEGYIQMESI